MNDMERRRIYDISLGQRPLNSFPFSLSFFVGNLNSFNLLFSIEFKEKEKRIFFGTNSYVHIFLLLVHPFVWKKKQLISVHAKTGMRTEFFDFVKELKI